MIERAVQVIKYIFLGFLLRCKKRLGINTTSFSLKNGGRFRIRNNDKIGIQLLSDERFEKVEKDVILSNIREGSVVLDIGANIGYYTVLMAMKAGKNGKVVSFEPNPVVFRELEYNVRLNELDNVVLQQTALFDSNGHHKLFFPDQGREAHSSLMQNETFKSRGCVDVITEKLDDALARLDLSRVDFIKMDVEGAERSIFSGAEKLLSSGNRPIMVFECAENLCKAFGHNVYEVLSYLSSFGYVLEEAAWGVWYAVPRK